MRAEPKSPPQNDMPLKPAEVRVEVPKHAEPPKQEEPPATSMKKQGERRRQGVSAEAGATGNANYQKVVHEKTAQAREMIAQATASSSLFAGLNDAQRNEVVDAMFEKKYTTGDKVIVQGDVGDNFYVVDNGEFDVILKQAGDKPVHTYQPGGNFGELALMYNCPRAASVVCRTPGSCWALDQATFRAILMAANKTALDSTASFLKSVSILSPLTDAQRDALGTVLEEIVYKPKQTIVREGDVADSLFLIKSGEVIAYKSTEDGNERGKELGRMKQSEFFGESSLEGDEERRKATVVADENVVMLKLSRYNFTELLGNLREVIKFNFNQKVLGSMDLFKELSEAEKALLVESLQEESYKNEEPVIVQGQVGDAFYIIKSGSVAVAKTDEKGEVTIIKEYLGPSEYFGEMALMKDEPRMASVIATSATTVMKLDRGTFNVLLGPMDDVLNRETKRRHMELARADRVPVRMEDLHVLSILGVGTFGRVKLVLNQAEGGVPCALKCMRKGQVIALKQVEHVMNEKNLLEQCQHPFLLELKATFQDDEEIYMLLELALGGELFSVLREKNRFEEPQSRFYAACVQSAFAYLHDKQIVYRDLKPENLLFDAEGYLKVVDFGFAKHIIDRTWTLCGTPEYLAPEIITNKGHNLAVDWWAFGILMFEMLVGQPPFCADDPMDIYQKILRNRVAYPSSMSKAAKDLISKLLISVPAQRLGSLKKGHRDISGHPFFKPLEFSALLKKEIKAPYIPNISSPTDTSNFDDYEEDNAEDWARFNDKRNNLFPGF